MVWRILVDYQTSRGILHRAVESVKFTGDWVEIHCPAMSVGGGSWECRMKVCRCTGSPLDSLFLHVSAFWSGWLRVVWAMSGLLRITPIATALAHVADPPPPLPPGVPTDLAKVIMACLAKDPDERPESAAEVARMLADMDEAATVSLVLAENTEEAPVADDVPLQPAAQE